MEKPPSIESTPDNQREQELSFEQQVKLAKTLFNAVNERNTFIKGQGGFDTFAEAGQYMDGMRDAYDKMEQDVFNARKEFDEKIPDKKEFVEKLKGAGEDDLANAIGTMFGVTKKKIFSRIKEAF